MRKDKTQRIKSLADAVIMIDIMPAVKTHLGDIDMLDKDANCIQNVGKDWVYLGTLEDLTDQEFDQVFASAQDYAKRLCESFCHR